MNIWNYDHAPQARPGEGRPGDTRGGKLKIPVGEEDFHLRELLRMLWRMRRVILGTIILITAAAAVISFQLTPKYSSTAQVMIEPRENKVLDIQAVVAGLSADSETINSEVEILKSHRLAQRVIAKLELAKDPEFNPALRRPTMVQSLIADAKGWLGLKRRGLTEQQIAAQRRSEIIETYLDKLSVGSRARTRVINISFSSEEPAKAAKIANTVADLYLVDQLEAKFEATERASKWLGERVQQLQDQVNASERAIERYRAEAGLVSGKNEAKLIGEQISELSSALILAKGKRAEAQARLDQAQRLMKSGSVYSAAEVLSSQLIDRLREQEAEVVRKVAKLTEDFGPKHPEMINARKELRDIRGAIEREVRKILQNLENEVQVASARETSLRQSLANLEQKSGSLNQKAVKLRALERDAEANRQLLKTMMTRFRETSVQRDITRPDARIISAAVIPIDPYFPKPVLIVGLALVVSTFLGMLLAVAAEQLHSGFRSLDEIEQMVGAPGLGLIPKLSRGRPADYALKKPMSAYAEALRNVRLGIALSDVDHPPKVVLITSSVPEEGKSSTSLAMARLLAKSGQRVLLIDCDLRRPSLHTSLGMEREPGLVEVLSDQVSFEEAVRQEEQSGVHYLSSGGHAPNPADLLGSDHMRALVERIGGDYELVILDSAPVISVTDSRILAGLADASVLLVRWDKTRRETVVNALRQLDQVGASIAGVVLSQVDVKRHAQYGYSDSGYYHGAYTKYYAS